MLVSAYSSFDAKKNGEGYGDAFTEMIEEFGGDQDAVDKVRNGIREAIKKYGTEEGQRDNKSLNPSFAPPIAYLWVYARNASAHQRVEHPSDCTCKEGWVPVPGTNAVTRCPNWKVRPA